MIVLDTNVLSELMRPAPAEIVVRWVAAQPLTSLYTTSITQAEILHGIMLLPSGRRRNALENAAGLKGTHTFSILFCYLLFLRVLCVLRGKAFLN